jgi:hypothetical protein
MAETVHGHAATPTADLGAAGHVPAVLVGVVVAPGLAREVASRIADDVAAELRTRFRGISWRTAFEVSRLVEPPAAVTELFDAARRRLLEGNWDLALVVTDLPLRRRGRPLPRQVSPTHGVAIVSLPALGAIKLSHRLQRTLIDAAADLIGEGWEGDGDRDRRGARRRRREQHVLRELATDTAEPAGRLRVLFVPAVLAGNLRLLAGMVRANRPWRFAARLYGALVAAFAAGAFGVITSDVWRLAAAMEWWRLAALSLLSVTATILAIIAAHGLWERGGDPRVREQVILFNVATAITVTIGIVSMYLVLFVIVLAGSALVITPTVLRQSVGSHAGPAEYASLGWLIASFATVAGGLGAGLESREAVREAAYAQNADD